MSVRHRYLTRYSQVNTMIKLVCAGNEYRYVISKLPKHGNLNHSVALHGHYIQTVNNSRRRM